MWNTEGMTKPLGELIRTARLEKGLTQAELADEVATRAGTNIRQATIARTESGERSPTLIESAALAGVLDLDPQSIFDLVLPADLNALASTYATALQRLIMGLDQARSYARDAEYYATRANTLRIDLDGQPALKRAFNDLPGDIETLRGITKELHRLATETNTLWANIAPGRLEGLEIRPANND